MKTKLIAVFLLLGTVLVLELATSGCDPRDLDCDGAMASLKSLEENMQA